MVLEVSYKAEIKDKDYDFIKNQIGADTDEEFIGFFKGIIKTQSTDNMKVSDVSVQVITKNHQVN